MATMPDLPTSDVGLVAYWNAIDNGAISIDPKDALSYFNLAQYKQYDNGIRGTATVGYSERPNSFFNFRVKSDGWVIVWISDTEDFYGTDYSGSEAKDNLIDFFDDWTSDSYNGDFIDNGSSLAIIAGLADELTGDPPNPDNVDIYCYAYPNATNINVIKDQNATFSYTSGITRKYEALAGYDYNTSKLITPNGSAELADGNIFAVDSISSGLTPDEGTSYELQANPATILGIFQA